MKMTIESTDNFRHVKGAPARRWKGVTEGGVACDVWVRLIQIPVGSNLSEFERDLQFNLPDASTLEEVEE